MEVNTTRDVTRLFWPRQDGRQFLAQPADFKRLKKQFSGSVGEKKVGCVCEVGTLLLRKNLRYKNFVPDRLARLPSNNILTCHPSKHFSLFSNLYIFICNRYCCQLSDDCFVRSMKLRVANKSVSISPTPEIYILFPALVLPLSTFIVDEVFNLSAGSQHSR